MVLTELLSMRSAQLEYEVRAQDAIAQATERVRVMWRSEGMYGSPGLAGSRPAHGDLAVRRAARQGRAAELRVVAPYLGETSTRCESSPSSYGDGDEFVGTCDVEHTIGAHSQKPAGGVAPHPAV
jgi:hypothetical protein